MSIDNLTIPPWQSPISGNGGIIQPVWVRFFNSVYNNLKTAMPLLSNDTGDASLTLTPQNASGTFIWNTPLTGNRTITISAGAVQGNKVRFVRTVAATGASTLTFQGKSLSAGQWYEWEWSNQSGAWFQTAAGSLL